jgi:hypothetical protein
LAASLYKLKKNSLLSERIFCNEYYLREKDFPACPLHAAQKFPEKGTKAAGERLRPLSLIIIFLLN